MPEELRKKIKAVNMTLTDFAEGITTFEAKLDKILGGKPETDKDVVLSEYGVIRLKDELCLRCRSDHLSYNGTNPKSLERGFRIEAQRYLCNSCGYNFTAPIEGYLKKNTIEERP